MGRSWALFLVFRDIFDPYSVKSRNLISKFTRAAQYLKIKFAFYGEIGKDGVTGRHCAASAFQEHYHWTNTANPSRKNGSPRRHPQWLSRQRK